MSTGLETERQTDRQNTLNPKPEKKWVREWERTHLHLSLIFPLSHHIHTTHPHHTHTPTCCTRHQVTRAYVGLHTGDNSLQWIVTFLHLGIQIYTAHFQTCTWIDRYTGKACMHMDMHGRAPLIASEDIFYLQGEFHTHTLNDSLANSP
jgi:hypothetical protein